jgi:hypothetical protein
MQESIQHIGKSKGVQKRFNTLTQLPGERLEVPAPKVVKIAGQVARLSSSHSEQVKYEVNSIAAKTKAAFIEQLAKVIYKHCDLKAAESIALAKQYIND